MYNSRFQFNVNSDNDRVKIQIFDKSGYIELVIEMLELRDYMNDQSFEIKELWFEFGN